MATLSVSQGTRGMADALTIAVYAAKSFYDCKFYYRCEFVFTNREGLVEIFADSHSANYVH